MTLRRRLLPAVPVVACLAIVAGCGSSSGTGTSSSSSSGSSALGGSGGTLTIGSSVAPPSIDPTSNAAAAIDEVFDYNVYQHLVQLAPDGKIVPVLATSYAWSADRKTITFTIRQGVKFSNGDPLTPADVVFSIQRVVAKGSKYPYTGMMGSLTAKTVGKDQVAVTLAQPNNEWLYQLAAYSNGEILDPKAVGTIATKPVGTGPYEFSSQVSNYSETLVANKNYWGGTPGLSTVVFRYFSDANSENSALESGQIQVIDNLANPTDVTKFQGQPSNYKIVAGPTDGKIQLSLNNAVGPLKNVAVRQAINYAIDKQAILKTVGAGYGTVIGSDTVPGDPWYSASYAKTYGYNPNKAKQLLSQAGYAKGLSLTLTLPPYGYATQAGPLIQAYLKAVGINVTIKDIQWPLWLSQVFTAKNFDMTIIDHVEARDVANYATPTYYWNYPDTSQVASLLAAGNASVNPSGEVQKYTQVLKMITGSAVNAWLYNPDNIAVAKPNVTGLPGGGHAESFNLMYASLGGKLPAAAKAEGFKS